MHHSSNYITYKMHVFSVIYLTSLWPNLDHWKKCYWLVWYITVSARKIYFQWCIIHGKCTCIFQDNTIVTELFKGPSYKGQSVDPKQTFFCLALIRYMFFLKLPAKAYFPLHTKHTWKASRQDCYEVFNWNSGWWTHF